MKKILIIEDDPGLNRGLSFALEQEGYKTKTAKSLREGTAFFHIFQPNALVLDLNLPDGDGIDFCRELRKKSDIPVIMLTARDMEVDEIMGLQSGADDYITKPFAISVLKVRLQKLLDRKNIDNKQKESLTSGSISLFPDNVRAFCAGKELDLSLTEFRLLQYFLENQDRILLKEQILQRIWDTDSNFVEENTLMVNISRLRKKIGENHIRTVHGMGYLWQSNEVMGKND